MVKYQNLEGRFQEKITSAVNLARENLDQITDEKLRNCVKKKELIKQEREWRKLVLEEVVARGLLWYQQSGIFKTDLHQRLIKDTMDTLQIASSGNITIKPDSTKSAFS